MNSSLSKLLQILKNHFLQAYLEAVTTRLVIVIAILPPTTCAKVIYVNFSVHHVPSIYVYSSQWKKDSIFWVYLHLLSSRFLLFWAIFQILNSKIQLKIFSNHTFLLIRVRIFIRIDMIIVQYHFGNIDIILEVNWP